MPAFCMFQCFNMIIETLRHIVKIMSTGGDVFSLDLKMQHSSVYDTLAMYNCTLKEFSLL